MKLWRGLRCEFEAPPWVIGIVGAGGKSTLLHRLAQEAAAAGYRVVATTTTRWWIDQWRRFGRPLLASSLETAQGLVHTLLPGEVLSLARVKDESTGKVVGLPAEWIEALLPHGDVILVEADGARGKPLKAPAPFEPVLPHVCSHVILVAGWHGIGKPLNASWVHRPQHFARVSGLALEAPVTVSALVRVLTHPQGGLQHLPPHSRVVVVINQIDDEHALHKAREAVPALLACDRVDEVLLASLQAADPLWEVHGRVGVVVLAAGAGTRFGGPKQVTPWRGRPLIMHVLDAVAQVDVDEVVVVLGAYASRVEAVLARWHEGHPHVPLRVVVNPRWQEGQSTSVRVGVEALSRVSAALFLPADQPLISGALLATLMATHRKTLAPAVVPRYGGQPGAPVLFDRRLFPELTTLRGDVGGRGVWQTRRSQVAWVDWPEPAVARDVDTPEDLAALDA